jgi:hypothetical protein
LDEGFDRLQKVLLAMNAGDELTPADAAKLSGLTEGVCRAMFEGLTRAGLMSAEADGRFVRQTVDVGST